VLEAHAITASPFAELYQKALDRRRIHFRLELVNFFYGLFALWLHPPAEAQREFRDWAGSGFLAALLAGLRVCSLLLVTLAVLTSAF